MPVPAKVNLNHVSDTTTGGSGTSFDQDSGIRVVNGGETFIDIKFGTAETVEDVLVAINAAGAGLEARTLMTLATGSDVRSRLSGNPLQIGELNGGETATQLGIRTFHAGTRS